MQDVLFYIFAALTLVCGFLVVANPFSRNPVTSAMFLVLTILSMAGLFVLLGAFFLAAVQVLVYAGAVIVLFLFVIMLLDLQVEERQRYRLRNLLWGGAASLALLAALLEAVRGRLTLPAETGPPVEGDPGALGEALFTAHLLPFEVMSILLLVAMIGVILLSRKEAGR
ncbi:MAG: NADH-quinone oxidoreductase subunit J [Verrucomicrobia bacterium]|nr:MAG: NADH-quinone oxidoreductase subunit J [Verrucomicrobiota bacterium]